MLKGIKIEITTRGNIFETTKEASFWFSSTEPGAESDALDIILNELKKEISKAVRNWNRPQINLYGYDFRYQVVDGFRYVNEWRGEVTYRAWDGRKGCYDVVKTENYFKKDMVDVADSAKLARELVKQIKLDAFKLIDEHGRSAYEM